MKLAILIVSISIISSEFDMVIVFVIKLSCPLGAIYTITVDKNFIITFIKVLELK